MMSLLVKMKFSPISSPILHWHVKGEQLEVELVKKRKKETKQVERRKMEMGKAKLTNKVHDMEYQGSGKQKLPATFVVYYQSTKIKHGDTSGTNGEIGSVLFLFKVENGQSTCKL